MSFRLFEPTRYKSVTCYIINVGVDIGGLPPPTFLSVFRFEYCRLVYNTMEWEAFPRLILVK